MSDETKAPGDPGTPQDPDRRQFFRRFAGEMMTSAAQVVGAVTELRDRSAAEASQLWGRAPATLAGNGGTPASAGAATQPSSAPPDAGLAGGQTDDGTEAVFRTPFRFGSDTELLIIDQRKLPDVLTEMPVRTASDAANAIRLMVVRGAPAIGELSKEGAEIAAAMWDEAMAIVAEANDDHGRLAEAGLEMLPATEGRPLNVLTHCNTGPLACGQFGTALGVVQAAHAQERPLHVWVDETRPYLQGARLTAWELQQAGVPSTLIPDMAAGPLMAQGQVDVILVGADRIAANGDTANKIGTYTLAVLAKRHDIPFVVCAPLSSVDLATADGAAIPIEDRSAAEVTEIRGIRIAPAGTDVRNPAFDVTPAELISAIVTEEGVIRPPFEPGLRAAMDTRDARRATNRPYAIAPAQVEAI